MNDMHTLNAVTVSNWFTDDATLWIPPSQIISGKSRIQALFRCMFKRYEALRWTVLEIMPLSDTRCIFVSQSFGTIKGKNAYANHVMTDVTFTTGGLITNLSDFFKDTSVFSE